MLMNVGCCRRRRLVIVVAVVAAAVKEESLVKSDANCAYGWAHRPNANAIDHASMDLHFSPPRLLRCLI